MTKSGSAMSQEDTIDYAYNIRSELTNALARADADYNYAYVYDDIGNRISSTERGTNTVYATNELNQYTAVDDFTPEFDADGNQTLVKTTAGIWRITYNGENRPVNWRRTPDNKMIVMAYDHMGRRREMNMHHFFYYGYLQISDASDNDYIWDPVEPIATKPLTRSCGRHHSYYAYDGNKNVINVVTKSSNVVAHYEYAPFGTIVVLYGDAATRNPWRFSSEYADESIGVFYFNYRSYEPRVGRWMVIDIVLKSNVYSFVANAPMDKFDVLGAYGNPVSGPQGPVGPSNPYDPGGCMDLTELRADCDLLAQKLYSMCPGIGVCVKTAWQSCCCGLDCRAQARKIADSVYSVVLQMQKDVIAGGWLGNLASWFGYGYGCVEWQKAVVDAVNDSILKDSSCFKGIGVGTLYPYLDLTMHNWTKIFGPNTPYLLNPYIQNFEGVEVDPWPSGGQNIFPGSFPSIDKPTYWKY